MKIDTLIIGDANINNALGPCFYSFQLEIVTVEGLVINGVLISNHTRDTKLFIPP